MAGINEYRRAGGYYMSGLEGQGQGPTAGAGDVLFGQGQVQQDDPYYPGSGRASSRGGEYYRSASPYAAPSPRMGYPGTYGLGLVDSPGDDASIQTVAAKSAGLLAIVVENLLSHPFLVCKRQCQVHVQSGGTHIFPFTLVNPIFQICQRQGVAVLWKGLGSTLVVRGMALAVEDVTSKVTPCPKEISRHSSTKAVLQHLLLKAISAAVITPFYSASLVETVQSDVASETAGFFDVFREGFWRLLAWPSTGRLVPLHVLVVPTVTHGLLSYLIYSGVRSASVSAIRRVRESKERKQGALSKDTSVSYYTEMTASLVGNMAADIILFPLETVINRLHLQGTRTIIDNLDNGVEVTPILTSYAGVLDCLRSTVDSEGVAGLYKGFGALILQYGLQILIIRTMKVVLERTPFGFSAGSPNGSGASTPPLPEKYGAVRGTSTTPVPQSRSEPLNINVNARRTPPTTMNIHYRDYPEPDGASGGGGDVRYRSSRFSNFSPTQIR